MHDNSISARRCSSNSFGRHVRAVRRFAVSGLVLVGLFVVAPLIAAPTTADAAGARPSMVVIRGNMETRALGIAVRHEGAPYVYGADGPHAFDCSGLTSFSLHHAGFTRVPRTAAEQARFARRIPRRALRQGDLIFFYHGRRVYHVGFFAGWRRHHRMMVDAPHTGQRVRRQEIWPSRWFAGTLR